MTEWGPPPLIPDLTGYLRIKKKEIRLGRVHVRVIVDQNVPFDYLIASPKAITVLFIYSNQTFNRSFLKTLNEKTVTITLPKIFARISEQC